MRGSVLVAVFGSWMENGCWHGPTLCLALDFDLDFGVFGEGVGDDEVVSCALKVGFGEFDGDFELEFAAVGGVAAVGVSTCVHAIEVVEEGEEDAALFGEFAGDGEEGAGLDDLDLVVLGGEGVAAEGC